MSWRSRTWARSPSRRCWAAMSADRGLDLDQLAGAAAEPERPAARRRPRAPAGRPRRAESRSAAIRSLGWRVRLMPGRRVEHQHGTDGDQQDRPEDAPGEMEDAQLVDQEDGPDHDQHDAGDRDARSTRRALNRRLPPDRPSRSLLPSTACWPSSVACRRPTRWERHSTGGRRAKRDTIRPAGRAAPTLRTMTDTPVHSAFHHVQEELGAEFGDWDGWLWTTGFGDPRASTRASARAPASGIARP